MSDTSQAADVGASEPIPVSTEQPGEGSSTREMARALAESWRKRDEAATTPDMGQEAPPKATPPATPARADAAPPQEATGETTTDDQEPAPDAPIPRPRSWTPELDAHWANLPRETQEIVAAREADRDRAVRQAQNEAAERLKGLTAKEQLVEQARQYYQQTLPALQESLQNHIAGEFSDIRTPEDMLMLAQTDPNRYSRWDAAQKRLALVNEQQQQAQTKAQQQQQEAWNKWSAEQDRSFLEKAPELTDPVKGPKLRETSYALLKDVGFTDHELSQSWNAGQLRDHRVQLLIRDAALHRLAQAEAKKANAKPVPQVQKPGTSRPRGAADDDNIQALTQQHHKKQSVKSAAALLAAEWRSRS